jgi:hypothetical protein
MLAVALAPGLAFGWLTWRAYPGDLFGFSHQLVVRDYLNLWAGGQLALDGRAALAFQPGAYWDWLRAIFGDRLEVHTFSYPPHLLLLAMPFALLPMVAGFLAWAVASAAAMGLALRAAGLRPGQALAAVASPAVLENTLGGQTGVLLSGAALGGGLLLAGRRPALAGALLGLLSLKPQLGLLVPFCLAAGREWRTLGWAFVWGAAYALAGLLAFGPEVWLAYLTRTAAYSRDYMEAPFEYVGHMMMVTPFAAMRAWGSGLGLAYGIQSAVTILCVAAVGWAWWRGRSRGGDGDRDAAVALTLALAPLATPYAHSYDLACVAIACVLLAGADQRQLPWLAFTWIWPSLALLAAAAGWPGLSGAVLLVPAILAFRRCASAAGCSPCPARQATIGPEHPVA